MKEKAFIFDNNGTLAASRMPIRDDMAETLRAFADRFRTVIVTGSTWEDMSSQMPEDLLVHPNIDYWCNMGNTEHRQGELVYDSGHAIDYEAFAPILEHLNSPMKFRISYPNHIEEHGGYSINYTLLGRPDNGEPSLEIRKEYEAWDKENGQRLWAINYLSKLFPTYLITLGGQISIDIVEEGWDKSQVISHYQDEYDISFFGDRIAQFGNDNAIAHRIADIGGSIYAVESLTETIEIMQALIRRDQLDKAQEA